MEQGDVGGCTQRAQFVKLFFKCQQAVGSQEAVTY